MGTSTLRGWAAAAAHADITASKLRRLVASGTVRTVQDRGVHVFDITDLERLRDTVRATDALPVVAADPATPNECTPDKAEREMDDEVVAIQRAAMRERAEFERLQAATSRIAAEVQHARAVQERDEAIRAQREELRDRRTEEIVGATIGTVFKFEEQRVEQVLRQRLVGIEDLDDRFGVAAVVAATICEVRTQLAAEKRSADERAAAFRQANAQAHAVRVHTTVRAQVLGREARVAALVANLATELRSMNLAPHWIGVATTAAQQQLELLDERVLKGPIWSQHAARCFASTALGAPPPEAPAVRDGVSGGWRWVQPGE